MLAPTLILGGTIRVVAAIARSLHEAGITVDVASPQPSHPPRMFSRAVRSYFALPDHRRCPDVFIDALIRLIDEHKFDMLIPTSDNALVAVTAHSDLLRRRLYVSCPPPAIVRKVLDKRITLDAARECGIRTPREVHIETSPQEANEAPRFPVVGKPAEKLGGREGAVSYFGSFEDLRNAFAKDPTYGVKNLLQEFCEGEGVGVTVLMWEGEPRAVFQHRRLRELPSRGGVSTFAEAQHPDPDLVAQSVALLRRLGWEGVAMVEFRQNPRTGSATLMEVNGRYWGSLQLAVRAGMVFPLYEWQLAHGLNPVIPERYTAGLRMLWRAGDAGRFYELFRSYCRGELQFRHLMREWLQFCRGSLSMTPDAVWSARDPLPAFAELYAKLKGDGGADTGCPG